MDRERFTTTTYESSVESSHRWCFLREALKSKGASALVEKSESELKLLQKSASANLEGILAAMRRSRTNEVVTGI